MPRWVRFAIVVFLTTFVVNVIVVAVWPDSDVDWVTAAIVGLLTSVVLTTMERRAGRLSG